MTIRQRVYLLMLLVLLVAGCQTAAPPTAVVDEPTPVPVTETTPAAAPTETAAATTEATAAPTATETAEPNAATADPFADIPWENRDVFRANLRQGQEGVLDALAGAPVYHLDVVVEENLTVVNGHEEVYYTNQEDVALNEIYFHLYPNLLGGNITISGVTVAGEPVEAVNEDTVVRVPLAEPLQPGESIVVGMDFTTEVPEEIGRNYGIFASAENVLALAHFYPVVAVYDDEGWNIEPAATQGDVTYADAAFYLVQVTAPAEQVIVATGVAIDQNEAADTETITFAAGPARDFYLALSDDYSVVSETVDGIQINSYAPAEFRAGAQEALDVAAEALQTFSTRYGPYPYSEFDIVTTPTLALGVEYPGVIANTVRIYDLENNSFRTPNEALLESTTAHEVGHQWFYNLIGNDQLNEPWLDEAVTQYATYQYYVDRYGEAVAQSFFNDFEFRWSTVNDEPVPIGMPVEDYSDREYGAIIYGRGPIFVNELAQAMGQDAFDTFMRTYGETYRWEIATTEEFKALAEATCDCDLTPLFEEWVYAN